MLSSLDDDFAGGLTVVRSIYPTNTPSIVGGQVTEIIVTGQGGILQPPSGFMGQRWILDNTTPTKSLVWITDFILNAPSPINPPFNESRYGMSVDYLSNGNNYMFVISGIAENVGNSTIGRPFIPDYAVEFISTAPKVLIFSKRLSI